MTRTVRTAIGTLLSVLLLWWAFRDVSFSQVIARFRSADLFDLSLAVIIALSSMWIRAFRWGILLSPVAGRVPFRPRLAATFIGFTVNNLVPGRVGEFARAFSLTRLAGVPVATAFATMVIERLLDGIVIVLLLFAVMALPGFPGFPTTGELAGVDVQSVALGFAGLMVAVGVALAVAVAVPRLAGKMARRAAVILPHRVREPTLGALRSFASGLAVLKTPSLFVVSAGLALFQWSFVALSFLYAFRAFGIEHVPYAGAVFVQSLLSLIVSIPSSPGYFGPFEFASVVGLDLWSVPRDQAISFAFGFHIAGFISVTLIGVYYIWRLNLDWSAVSHGDDRVEEELSDEAATGDDTSPAMVR